MRLVPALLALTAACLASSAWAKKEVPYAPAPPTITASPIALAIAAFDRDGDLRVSRPEYDWGVSRSFVGFDRNGDGAISLIELSAWAEATLGNSGALPGAFDFDRDGDDRISQAEFSAYFAARFAALDKNNDAALNRSELVSIVDSPIKVGRDRRKPDIPRP